MSPCYRKSGHLYGQENHFCETSTKSVFCWQFRDTIDITDPQNYIFIHNTQNQNQPCVLTLRWPNSARWCLQWCPARYSYHCTPNYNWQWYFNVSFKKPILSIIKLPWCPNWALVVPGKGFISLDPKNYNVCCPFLTTFSPIFGYLGPIGYFETYIPYFRPL